MIAPFSYKTYMENQRDLDYIGYGYQEVYEYIFILSFKSYRNAIDIFYDDGTPFIPENPLN